MVVRHFTVETFILTLLVLSEFNRKLKIGINEYVVVFTFATLASIH